MFHAMSLLEFRHVGKHRADGRGYVAVLEDASLRIDEGDRVGIWGVRRSGKSTLLRIAAGLELPDEGTVIFDGKVLTEISQHERAALRRRDGIGLVRSPWRPLRNRPAIEHVAVALMSDGVSLRDAKRAAFTALTRADAADCAYIPTSQLSQGELVRVQLAQRLVHEPRMLLIDEPAMLSSPKASMALYELLWSLAQDSKCAIVIASEELDAIQPASRIMTISAGQLRSTDRPGSVVPFPEDRVAARQRSRR